MLEPIDSLSNLILSQWYIYIFVTYYPCIISCSRIYPFNNTEFIDSIKNVDSLFIKRQHLALIATRVLIFDIEHSSVFIFLSLTKYFEW